MTWAVDKNCQAITLTVLPLKRPASPELDDSLDSTLDKTEAAVPPD